MLRLDHVASLLKTSTDARLPQSVERVARDLGVESSRPTLGLELT